MIIFESGNNNPKIKEMKKRHISMAIVLTLACSITFSSCIGSFRLTHSVLKWNNQVGSKFLNEVVFFAFWILPVYEVTALADILVINSIEFWSGKNPLTASTKVVDTDHGRYLIACDGKGYTVTHQPDGESYRLDFIEESQTWALNVDGELHPFMTFVDDNRVKMITPSGDFRTVDLSEEGVMAYQQEIFGENPEILAKVAPAMAAR